jgi:molybdate transport system substrate-binding protein
MGWRLLGTAVLALLLFEQTASVAAETHVAVAANFTEPAKEIAALFEKATGDVAVLSFGASGPFYEQISQGAPFQVFLSADQTRPQQAEKAGLAVPGSEFTYAVGKLVLWSRSMDVAKGDEALRANAFEKLSIADPKGAPYGAAAVEVLKALKVYDAIQPKLVQGASIAQAFQFVDTGNAQLGFVALSQLAKVNDGTRWLAPQELYTPIRQDAVLLKTGADDATAKAFVAFLKSPGARAIIEKYGYGLE